MKKYSGGKRGAVKRTKTRTKAVAKRAVMTARNGGTAMAVPKHRGELGVVRGEVSALTLPAPAKTTYAPKIRSVFEESGKVNVRELATIMDVSLRKVASGIGVTEGAVRNRPDSDRAQPGAQRIVNVLQRAYASIGDWKETMIWLRSNRRDLSGLSPLDLIISGRGEIVEDLLDNIETGQPG
jgi:uncharacterized protein (DUF2384 family)